MFRDDRLYYVACDDTYAPKQYFESFRIRGLHVIVIPTVDGSSSAEHVLGRVLDTAIEDGDERWILLDTDHYIEDSHKKSFIRTLDRAKAQNVNVAVSRPSFEIWLLLHFLKANDPTFRAISCANDVGKALKELHGSYSKTNLDTEIFDYGNLCSAIKEGEILDRNFGDSHIPEGNSSRVYNLWLNIIRSSSLAQLPEVLKAMKVNS